METLENTTLTGREGREWDLNEAISWTKNYRDKYPDRFISHYFGREILEKILAQDGCVGLRFYHALDERGKEHLIIAGTAANGEDQLQTNVAVNGAALHLLKAIAPVQPQAVGQESMPCPGSPGCPKQSVLSGNVENQ